MKLATPRIYGFGMVEPDPRWHLAAHSHTFHEIIVVIQGRLLLKTGDLLTKATAGDVLFYRAGLVHEETSDPRAPVRTFFISLDTRELLPWPALRTRDVNGRVRQIVAWIIEDEQARRGPEARRSLLELLFWELRRIGGAPPDPWLGAILAYARAQLAEPIHLDDLARVGKMSRFAFVRKFKRLSGRTPMEELRRLRLDQARLLLLTTSLPVKAIAPAVGIGDEHQLSKLFRSHFNLTPSDFRKRK